MRQVINTVSGCIFGLAPLAGATIIGITIYAALPNITGIIIIGLLGILSLWLGIKIFYIVKTTGPIEFMTAVNASPAFDNIEPTGDNATKRRSPEELIWLIKSQKNLFKGGAFRIFGDWFGKPYENFHEIESAEFESQSRRLTLSFNDGEKLEIYNPKHIFEAPTFLKIVNADRVTVTWFYSGKIQSKIENQYFLDYMLKGQKITTETNVDWYKPKFDVSLGAPALIIFG